ncbi:CaiB/BaiF CoA-transferase family protein [Bordetella sp. BOR01]|uniref:CaiB/BaiF CoA transferase family protein n=1 Tax=Bordetella sp. BOR01 TaxID=2854779 RepID=UPI001C46C392|nr:CoA transferase [Bordetella sp. BOR01]MBV7483291.1 CoA transferase [Bordetella sp. BOR01]
MADQRLPLEGVRVLDLATMIAAPFCASILGEFGAEVIKVEQPGGGDPFRSFGTMTGAGSTLNFINESRNKLSITLDLRKPEGAEILKDLATHCDIVVENFRPGTLERWGVGYEALKRVRPDLVMIRVSAYGQTGPYRHKPGYARVAHAYAGLSFLAGDPDGPPVVPGSTSLGDYIAGLYATIGGLMALISRQKWGVGQTVDVSLYEGIFRMLDELAPAYAKHGFVRERMGADTVNAVPHSHYQSRDGHWIALACSSDKMFARLVKVMGRCDLVESGGLASIDARIERREEVNQIVADWMIAQDRDDILFRLEEGNVPAGPVNNIADFFADPHVQGRETLIKMQHPTEGEVIIPNVVPRLSETPGHVRTLGPDLGQHNQAVYSGLLGLSDNQIADLEKNGII